MQSACLMRAILKRAKEATDPRLPKIQNESTVSHYCLHHYRPLIRSCLLITHTCNIREYNRHKRQMDFKYALILTGLFIIGVLQAESTGR